MTITADGPWQHLLHELTGRKWGNIDVENETGCGIVPYVYKKSSLVNAVQWAVGLELLLLIKDPWRIFLTTDHPNGAGFWRYPELVRLLMDVDYRRERLKPCRRGRSSGSCSPDLDRRYTLSEIVDHHVGGAGARARTSAARAISAWGQTPTWRSTDESPAASRCSSRRATSSRAARSWSRKGRSGRWSRAGNSSCARRTTPQIEEYLRPLFQQVYTISFENYPVEAERVHGMQLADAGLRLTRSLCDASFGDLARIAQGP